jgi:hypothetical protein
MFEGVQNGGCYSLLTDSLTWTCCQSRVQQIQSVRTRQSAAALSLFTASLAADQGWIADSFYLSQDVSYSIQRIRLPLTTLGLR